MIEAVEVDQRLIGKNQLIQRHVCGHRQTARLGLSDQRYAASTGELAEVRTHATLLDQQQISRQRHSFRGFRNARQAKETGGRPFMRQATFGQIMVLRIEDHRQVESRCIFQRPTQRARVAETLQAVAEGHATSIAQGNQLGQLLAVQALAQRADGEHLGISGLAGTVEDQFGHCRGVEHRFGLWRAAQAGHTASCGSAGFADNRALAAVTRLAQGDVEVDQPRGGDQPLSVDGISRDEVRRGGADRDNLAGLHMNVGNLIQSADGIDDASAEDAELHWAFSWSNWPCSNCRCAVCPLMAMDSTAIRMAIP
ncbi:hypothetical protein PS645_05087 [Pseudomonas fluorescens]|uniref:Uncharacterized protein n=1 Tax=Pseudomonas fluorescens TaxID=294 RepID=A0A5E6X4W5_PSEFL|nr:hypothetical protein PS645_05087 [Pseudomonas fluorescens]